MFSIVNAILQKIIQKFFFYKVIFHECRGNLSVQRDVFGFSLDFTFKVTFDHALTL